MVFPLPGATSVPAKDLEQAKGGSYSRNNTLEVGVKLGHLVRQLGCPSPPPLGEVGSECGYNVRCILKSGEIFSSPLHPSFS